MKSCYLTTIIYNIVRDINSITNFFLPYVDLFIQTRMNVIHKKADHFDL